MVSSSGIKTTNLSNAILHEERVRMHAVAFMRPQHTNATRLFLNNVEKILIPDKARTFADLLTYPLETNQICRSIFQEYPRVLSAANRYVKVTFSASEVERAFDEYLTETGFEDFWNGEAMTSLYRSHNAFIACDKDENGRAYFYQVPIKAVTEVEMSSPESVERIKFHQDKLPDDPTEISRKFAEFDGERIRVTGVDKNGNEVVLKEFRHGLGYCPVCKFLPKAVDTDFTDSENPITACLNELDDYLFWHTCLKHYKLYGAFPIYWAYRERCNYVDERLDAQCEDGKLIYTDAEGNAKVKPCPKCSAKPFIGAGSLIQIDPPSSRDEVAMGVPVGKLDVDANALRFMSEDQELRKRRIEYDATGRTFETTGEAINELQVRSNYETRKTVLENLSKTLSKSMWFVLNTLAKLTYPQYHVNTSVDLGNQFFLKTLTELNADYKELKQSGRPFFELSNTRNEIYQTRYQNNPEALARLRMLRELEPYQDLSLSELSSYGIKETDPDGYVLKLAFNDTLAEFERRYAPVESYGELLPMPTRVNEIKLKFKQIQNEKYVKPAPAVPDDGGNSGKVQKL